MTNQEAITKLTNIMHDDHYAWSPSILEAFRMAVEALKGADGDCISRAEAIDAFYKYQNINWTTLDVLAKIKELPSVTLELPIKKKCTICPHCDNCDVNDDGTIAQPEHATCYLDGPCEYQNINITLPSAQPEIIHCRECKHWKQQTNYAGAPLSFGFCESDDMWRSLYGETCEVSHIDTDDDFYCGFAERRTDD